MAYWNGDCFEYRDDSDNSPDEFYPDDEYESEGKLVLSIHTGRQARDGCLNFLQVGKQLKSWKLPPIVI